MTDLQELVDRSEITDLLHRYTVAIDTGEWDRLDQVFAPDAQLDYTESGGIAGAYPQVKEWVSTTLPAFAPRRMHTLGQVVVTFGTPADEARVTAYFHNPMYLVVGDAPERLVEVGGIYHHTVRRTPAGWRSVRLHEQVVWTRGFGSA